MTRFRAWVALLTLAVPLGACGGQASTTSTRTAGAGSGPASGPGLRSGSTTATTRSGNNVTFQLAGLSGAPPLTLAAAEHLRVGHRTALRPHISGLTGLSLPSEIQYLANTVGGFWSQVFQANHYTLVAPSVTIVSASGAACGATQILTTDRPVYCGATSTLELPLSFVSRTVVPNGDAATTLLIATLYGQHLEKLLGLASTRSASQLERISVCFAGNFFTSLEDPSQSVHLGAGDEHAVNAQLSEEALLPTVPGSDGTVSAADLTAAFNRGVMGSPCASVT